MIMYWSVFLIYQVSLAAGHFRPNSLSVWYAVLFVSVVTVLQFNLKSSSCSHSLGMLQFSLLSLTPSSIVDRLCKCSNTLKTLLGAWTCYLHFGSWIFLFLYFPRKILWRTQYQKLSTTLWITNFQLLKNIC